MLQTKKLEQNWGFYWIWKQVLWADTIEESLPLPEQKLLRGNTFSAQQKSLTTKWTSMPASQFYDAVVSKCRILHGTYLATPWLSSPHLQTVFLNFFGRPPFFKYRRSLINNLTFLDSIVLPTDSRYVVCVIVVGLFDSSNDCACVMFLFQTTVYYSWWRNRCFGLAVEFWRYYYYYYY